MTATPLVPVALAPLVYYLDRLTGRAPLDDLCRQLRTAHITVDQVRGYVRFDEVRYRRNLVVAGEWYQLLVLCWRSGQCSPIHDHAESSCAFKVLAGVCRETAYRRGPDGTVVPLATRDYFARDIVATQDVDIHQVVNLQPAGRDLVTLHIYTPPLAAMRIFNATAVGGDGWRAVETISADDWSV